MKRTYNRYISQRNYERHQRENHTPRAIAVPFPQQRISDLLKSLLSSLSL